MTTTIDLHAENTRPADLIGRTAVVTTASGTRVEGKLDYTADGNWLYLRVVTPSGQWVRTDRFVAVLDA